MDAITLPRPIQRRIEAAASDFLKPKGLPSIDFSSPPGEPAFAEPHSVSWRVFKNPIALFIGGTAAVILELAEPRRTFPLTGRYDVFAGDEDQLLGVVSRGGRFYDARGHQLGRLADARTWKEHLGEGVVTAVVESLIAGESASGDARGADAYLLTIGDQRAGTLARERLPFEGEVAEVPLGPVARALRRFLPKRAGDALFERRPPYAWKLDVADTAGVPDLLLLTAAILAIEIALW